MKILQTTSEISLKKKKSALGAKDADRNTIHAFDAFTLL